jgi:hypothetical protein
VSAERKLAGGLDVIIQIEGMSQVELPMGAAEIPLYPRKGRF